MTNVHPSPLQQTCVGGHWLPPPPAASHGFPPHALRHVPPSSAHVASATSVQIQSGSQSTKQGTIQGPLPAALVVCTILKATKMVAMKVVKKEVIIVDDW